MPVRIALIHRVVAGISIAVCADAGFVRVPPVRRDKPCEDGVIIAGVEEQQPGFRVVALADIAFGFGERCAGHDGFRITVTTYLTPK